MATDEDRTIVYDRAWSRLGEFRVAMTADGNAAVRSGPTEVLKSGEPYMAAIYNRYYACTADGSGGGLVLQLNAWSKEVDGGKA
jgi:hypothetical protein